MENDSKELTIRIERDLTPEEKKELCELITGYSKSTSNGSLEIGFF
jgi:hypothetical protein